MTQSARISGAWKVVDKTFVKIDGVWKDVAQTFVKVNGTWQSLSVPVPNLLGLSPTQADALITSSQLVKGTASSGFTSNSSLDNKVGAQSIAAGSLVVPGTAINYTFTTFLATPVKPTIEYVSATGKFRINPYNASLLYTITGGTRSGENLTLPSNFSESTIVARSFSGGDASPSTLYANKFAEYTPDTRYRYQSGTTSCNCGYRACGCECAGGGCGCYGGAQSWGQCGCPGVMCWYNYGCDTCPTFATGGSAPELINQPGYTWSGTEWYKIV